jgi:hypothetical protein
MPRTFDSLRMANRAFYLYQTWESQWLTYRTRDRSIVPMSRDLVDRMYRAWEYLYRRVRRNEAR